MPTYKFSSTAGLVKALKQAGLKQMTEKLGEDVKYLIKAYMEESFYGTYDPIKYHRTFQMLNSVVTSEARETANGFEIEVYIDISSIDYNGFDEEYVVYLASQGFHGSSDIYRTGEFWDEAMIELHNGYIQKKFGEYLREKGWNVSVR